jgi:hypothetical protein
LASVLKFSEEKCAGKKPQGFTSSARISWFFIALSQKSGTPFSSAEKHCNQSEKGESRSHFTSLIQVSLTNREIKYLNTGRTYFHLFALQGLRL